MVGSGIEFDDRGTATLKGVPGEWQLYAVKPALAEAVATVSRVRAAELDLDLDVFAGPFDLLMAVVLREEVSLAEVSLGEIVVAYLEHLEGAGELDLDAATEFLVLIASLLELKSRLLLPGGRRGEPELGPEEAADELLARMLEYRRYRDAAAHLSRALRRRPPLPLPGRSAAAGAAARFARRGHARCTSRAGSPRRSATCCGRRPQPDTSHIRPTVSLRAPAGPASRAARPAGGASTSTRRSPTRTG